MKSFFKLGFLLSICSVTIGCNQVSEEPASNHDSNNATTIDEHSNSDASDEFIKPTSQLKPTGQSQSVEDFQNNITSLTATPHKAVRLNFHIVETLVGTAPKYMADGSTMEEGKYISDFAIVTNDYKDDSHLNYTKVSGECKTNEAKSFTSGQGVFVSSWLAYQKQRARFRESAQEGEGFDEYLASNPYTMWMYSWGVRPANSTFEGHYFASEEFLRTFDETGMSTSYTLIDTLKLDGTLKSWHEPDREYKGLYTSEVKITFDYFEED